MLLQTWGRCLHGALWYVLMPPCRGGDRGVSWVVHQAGSQQTRGQFSPPGLLWDKPLNPLQCFGFYACGTKWKPDPLKHVLWHIVHFLVTTARKNKVEGMCKWVMALRAPFVTRLSGTASVCVRPSRSAGRGEVVLVGCAGTLPRLPWAHGPTLGKDRLFSASAVALGSEVSPFPLSNTCFPVTCKCLGTCLPDSVSEQIFINAESCSPGSQWKPPVPFGTRIPQLRSQWQLSTQVSPDCITLGPGYNFPAQT